MIDRDYVRRNPNHRRHRAEMLAAVLICLQFLAFGSSVWALGYIALRASGGVY